MTIKATATIRVVKDFDGKRLEALRRRLSGKNIVKVGFPDNSPEKDGTPMAAVAATHEFGDPDRNIPERSFMRTSLAAGRGKYINLCRKTLKGVAAGTMSKEQALGLLGEVAKSDMQRMIRRGDFAPLSPRTIAQKKSSKPLIDTGQMIQSITYEIEK